MGGEKVAGLAIWGETEHRVCSACLIGPAVGGRDVWKVSRRAAALHLWCAHHNAVGRWLPQVDCGFVGKNRQRGGRGRRAVGLDSTEITGGGEGLANKD